MKKNVIIIVAILVALCIAGTVFATGSINNNVENATEQNNIDENVAENDGNLQELPPEPTANDVAYQRMQARKSASKNAERKQIAITVDNEFINGIAKQKIFSDLQAKAINDAPDWLLGKSYDEAKELMQYYYEQGDGILKEECRLYALAVALGKDLAYEKLAFAVDMYNNEINWDTNILPNNLMLDVGLFEKKIVEEYIRPLYDNGKYDTVIRELTVLEEYAASQIWYIANMPGFKGEEYIHPDYNAIFARVHSGEKLSDIFYLDNAVKVAKENVSQLR